MKRRTLESNAKEYKSQREDNECIIHSTDETGDLDSNSSHRKYCSYSCEQEFKATVASPSFGEVSQLFCSYMHYFWQGRGKLSPFWMSCVDMVETLLGLLEHLEKRMGNFTSHLTTKFSLGALHMIISTTAGTICITAWNITFTRETPGHLEYFRSGGFSVQMSEDNPFGRIPVDQTSEETVNKDTQTSRGTKGQSTA